MRRGWRCPGWWLRLTGNGTPPRRLLIISPPHSYRISPYLRAAERLNVEAIVGSSGRQSLITEVATGIQLPLEQPVAAIEIAVAALAKVRVAAVLGTDDNTVELAGRIAARLSLPHNSPDALRLTRRKDLGRAALQVAGLPVPDHLLIELTKPLRPQLSRLFYPAVIKPLALSGSRGVLRVDSPATALTACKRIAAIVADQADAMERSCLLAERYLPGDEVAVEGFLQAGKLELLAVFDKPELLEGPYFEESYYVTPSRIDLKLQEQMRLLVEQVSSVYGLRQGPIHAELRLNSDGIWPIEVAARTIGGECARLFKLGSDMGLEELVIARALGLSQSPPTTEGAAGVLMIPIPKAGVLRRVEGVLAASQVPGIEALELAIREGYELVPLPEGSRYLGFIFARADSAAAVEAALREAHSRLKVVVAPLLHLATA